MLTAVPSAQLSNFIGEYFKDMILVLLFVIYVVVFVATRPKNAEDERISAKGRRAAEAAEAAKQIAR